MTKGLIDTWTPSLADEQAMEDGHQLTWARLIELAQETDYAGQVVLDFGCNQGGFLRALAARKPYAAAVGCDIARAAIEVARARRGDLPIDYVIGHDLDAWPERFAAAFSHEVIYLIPDLVAHARAVLAALLPDGVYYAVTGCHSDNPEWPAMREEIAARASIPPVDRGIDDYARDFATAGFTVTARRFGLDAFIPAIQPQRPDRGLLARLHYYDSVKICFRLVKPAAR